MIEREGGREGRRERREGREGKKNIAVNLSYIRYVFRACLIDFYESTVQYMHNIILY